MSQEKPHAERYIGSAPPCLKAINDTAANAGDREQKIQASLRSHRLAFSNRIKASRQMCGDGNSTERSLGELRRQNRDLREKRRSNHRPHGKTGNPLK